MCSGWLKIYHFGVAKALQVQILHPLVILIPPRRQALPLDMDVSAHKTIYFNPCAALQEGRLVDDAKFVGSSAGSLVGLALGMETLSEPPTCPLGLVRAQLTELPTAALGLSFERIRDFQLGCVDRTHGSLVGAFSLKKYVDEIMDDMLPDDAYITIGDRVEVSVRVGGTTHPPIPYAHPFCNQPLTLLSVRVLIVEPMHV
jgi:hypothetical protein